MPFHGRIVHFIGPFVAFVILLVPVSAAGLPASLAGLGELTEPPPFYVDGQSTTPASPVAGQITAGYFASVDYRGAPTRVYAYIGLPSGASAASPVPGVVLVHGGGGTAYIQWVQKWMDRGYAAMSIAVEGQTDTVATQAQKDAGLAVGDWLKHAMPGPARAGIYGDSAVTPVSDQWMYHATAATILANSLMRSLPAVDAAKVGLTGISWGGVITATAAGIDHRFRFAIPVYGCGNMDEAPNWWGNTLSTNELYKTLWDPMLYLGDATMPMLWLSWPAETNFPLDCQADSYRAAPGAHMVSLVPGMGHGHPPGWNRPESYAFADSVIAGGAGWCRQESVSSAAGTARAVFRASTAPASAVLFSTTGTGATGGRTWVESPAELAANGDGTYTASAPIPAGTTAWFLNTLTDTLVASTDFQELPAPATVTLEDLVRTYDGTPQSVSVTTDPAGLPVVVTYAGSTNAPSAAGDYAVEAAVTDGNYLGVSSATLSIRLSAFDAWRRQHFGDDWEHSESASSTADADADGVPNRVEYHLGTDPGDPRSKLSVELADVGSDVVTIRLRPAVTEGSFTLESAPVLGQAWQKRVLSVAGNAPAATFDIPCDSDRCFFRVVYRPPEIP
ncbi:MAG: MBG domain-containing protein [Chthoniobacterales bacterium]|jgi:dienelactone hydrolase